MSDEPETGVVPSATAVVSPDEYAADGLEDVVVEIDTPETELETPAVEETSTIAVVSIEEEAPVEEETHGNEETPVEEDTHFEEETPVIPEIVTVVDSYEEEEAIQTLNRAEAEADNDDDIIVAEDDDSIGRENKNEKEGEDEEPQIKERRVLGMLLGLIGCSLLVLVEGSKACCETSGSGWAVSIGTISLVSSLLVLYVGHVKSKQFTNAWEIAFATAMFFTWGIGVIAMTFQGVFTRPGTGYFATWLSLIISGYYVVTIIGFKKPSLDDTALEQMQKDVLPYIAVLFLLTLGVLVQSSIFVAAGDSSRGVFTLAVCILTIIMLFIMALFTPAKFGGYRNYFFFSISYVVLWSCVILFGTMSEPFYNPSSGEVVANGFYATFGAFIASVVLMWHCHVLDIVDNENIVASNAKRIHLSGRKIWLALLSVTSTFVFIFAIVDCNEFDTCDTNAFSTAGIAIGFFSAAACLLILILFRTNPDFGDVLIINPDALLQKPQSNAEKIEVAGAVLLALTWVAVVIAFTFPSVSPFFSTNVGYFFAWISLIFSLQYLNQIYPKQRITSESPGWTCSCSPPNKQRAESNLGILISFVGLMVELVAVSSRCIESVDGNAECGGNEFFVYALVGVSLGILAILLIKTPAELGHGAIIFNFLYVTFWFVGLAVITTRGPFVEAAGNGFYACWVVLFGGLYTLNKYEWALPDLELKIKVQEENAQE